MTDIASSGTFPLGDRAVKRIGYGSMQLAGPHVFGPPQDREGALAVLRAAVEAGVDHIDTADFYGPHVTNELIREALAPYSPNLTIVTKVGVRRGTDGAWNAAQDPATLTEQVHDNLRTLGLETIDVLNLRVIQGNGMAPTEGSIEERFAALAALREKGLIRHLGLSNVTAAQVEEARRIAPVVCVQNQYNIVNRTDDALIDILARQNIAYVPFFPLGGFSPVQSERLSAVARQLGHSPLKIALAWLLQRSPNILLIPGTSKIAHLRDNLAAASLALPAQSVSELDAIAA